jgi:membrane fusion protein (multidrug efflux system)
MLTLRWTFSRCASATALLLIPVFGCSFDHAGQAASETVEATEPSPNPVPVRVVVPVPVEVRGAYPSDLYVERDVWLTPRSTGIIEQVLVDRGDRVRKGQMLLVLETDLQEVEVQIAEQTLRFHEAEWKKSQELLEDKIVSALDALRDEIERDLAASELELARAKLERCTLRAPFDGIVVERLAVPGQRVMEEEGAKLLRLVADDRRRAKVHVPETRIHGLHTGDRAEIEPRGGSEVHTGRVVFISPAVDAASGTALVIVESESQVPALKIGSAVEVRLTGDDERQTGVFRIPREALLGHRVAEGRQTTILVVSAGHAVERRVDLVDLAGLDATVRGRFDEGDRVIVAGSSRLSSGDPVEVRSDVP